MLKVDKFTIGRSVHLLLFLEKKANPGMIRIFFKEGGGVYKSELMNKVFSFCSRITYHEVPVDAMPSDLVRAILSGSLNIFE